MKDVFSFVLATTLVYLYILNGIQNVSISFLISISFGFFLISLVSYFLKKYRVSYVLVAVAIAQVIGTGFVKDRIQYKNTIPTDVPTGEYVAITGYLTEFPEIQPDHTLLLVQTESITFQRKTIQLQFNARIKVKGDLRHLCRTDKISINAQLFHHRFHSNFYHNPLKDHVRIRKIHMSGACKSHRMVTRILRGSILWRGIGRWRNAIRKRIERVFLNSDGVMKEEGVFLEAILIGDRGRLSQQTREKLLHAGIFHLFAISGAHIGMIAVFSLLLLKWIPVSPHRRYGITIFILLLFLFLSGFKISAVRAVVMAVFFIVARLWVVRVNIFNIISFTALMILTVNPAECLNAGFVLTFSLTAAIVWGRRIFLPYLQKIPRSAGEFLSANLSASLMALPLSLLFFKRYACLGFLSGLLMIPVATIVMVLGMLLILAAPVSHVISVGILRVLSVPASLFFFLVDFLYRNISVTLYRASPPIWILLIYAVLYWGLGAEKIVGRRRLVVLSLFLLIGLGMTLKVPRYNPDHLEVYFLDVGQGESSVVVFPGGKALLIDGGGSWFTGYQVGKQVVLPFLLQKRINVQWVAVSHYHPDHCRGLIEMIPVLKPREIWISSEAKENSLYRQILKLENSNTVIKKVVFPFLKKVDGCRIELLFPTGFFSASRSSNNHSQIYRISDGTHAFLFTGDIEQDVELPLGESSCSLLKADVLKVPHHGSRSSSGDHFVRCVCPEFAVFSYSMGNSFGFPHPEVLERYKKSHVHILSTANWGGIKIISSGKNLKIELSRLSSN